MNIIYYTYSIPSTRNEISGVFNLNRIKALARNNNVVVFVPTSVSPALKNLFPLKIKSLIKDIKLKLGSRIFLIQNVTIYQAFWFKLPKRIFWKLNILLQFIFVRNKFKSIIVTFHPDIIIVSGVGVDLGSISLLKQNLNLKNVRIAVIPEGSDVLLKLPTSKIIRFYKNIIYKNDINVIAVSKFIALELNHKFKSATINMINNGFDDSIFRIESKKSNDSILRITCVGRLEYVKGYDFLINALGNIDHNFICNIIGDGNEKQNLAKLIRKLNLQEKVVLRGKLNQNEILNYLKECDVVIIPSRSESFCIAALEANGCGIPLITSNAGGLINIVIDGFNGYKFELENIKSFQETLEKFLNTPWDRQKIQKYTHDNYSWDKWAKQIIEVFI